ncbi:MAG: TetR/AcrR family transcriptional regulator [Sandaracinaceae bacterium]|nr:TetR/AcrR family transcriptional regulator [Sandaracinaceae bacterium]
MPRSPEENQQIRDARRDTILRAAERVFAQKGLAHTKIADIATAAGVSHGLVFHYFASKEAIFQELIEAKMARLADDFDDEAATPCERLEATLRNSFERLERTPESAQLMTQAMLLGGMPDGMRACAFEHARGLRMRMTSLLRECQQQGELTDDVGAEQLTSVLICVFRGMSIRPPGSPQMPFPMPTAETVLTLLRPKTGAQTGRHRALPKRGKRESALRKKT